LLLHAANLSGKTNSTEEALCGWVTVESIKKLIPTDTLKKYAKPKTRITKKMMKGNRDIDQFGMERPPN
jgi:hypothetical protein